MASLAVKNLHVELPTPTGMVRVVDRVSFVVGRGEVMGLVGESGSGKTMTIRAILGLLPPHSMVAGEVTFEGRNLTQLSLDGMRDIRRHMVRVVFQEPLTALNPTMRVVDQIIEGIPNGQAGKFDRAIALMDMVGLQDPLRLARAYPHQLSGGMRQRVVIAIALSGEPSLLLCDEPTTALDVTIQDQVLKLLLRLCRDLKLSLILVTHDLPVVAQICDSVAVIYAGQILETGPVQQVFRNPAHPYTRGLLRACIDFDRPNERLEPIPGMPADVSNPPSGCPFHPRCRWAIAECSQKTISLHSVAQSRSSACIRVPEILPELVVARG
jgi:oligopeptide/dipeptide ABC transporter ATP-binding protein